jgi:hypothetical protein
MITPVFNVLTSEASLRSAVQGLVDAVLITLLVAGYLMFVRDGRLCPWFRRFGFWTDLSRPRHRADTVSGGTSHRTSHHFITSLTEAHLLYALPFFTVVAITIQFVLQMNRMIGANVLGYFAAGIYRHPKAEERGGQSCFRRPPHPHSFSAPARAEPDKGEER